MAKGSSEKCRAALGKMRCELRLGEGESYLIRASEEFVSHLSHQWQNAGEEKRQGDGKDISRGGKEHEGTEKRDRSEEEHTTATVA